MIAVRLMGGLGNQLFQYAVGRTLARRRGAALAVDAGGFRWGDRRRQALVPFELAAKSIKNGLAPMSRKGGLLSWLGGRGLTPPLNSVRERQFSFDPRILDAADGSYLEGYFQSERYFVEIADVIRADLTLPPLSDARNRATLQAIEAAQSVSLHIRRGDYVTHARTNQQFGTCSPDYYARAADHIAQAVGAAPTFFVFSDDPGWTVANLRLPYPVHFITNNGARRAHEDLRLMSRCRHHIIANSSFSWWGAWLNPSATKVVVAPAVWFAGGGIDESTLVPERWVRL